MKKIVATLMTLALAWSTMGLVGCERETPAERRVEDIGDEIEDAADEAGEDLEDLGDRIEDRTE